MASANVTARTSLQSNPCTKLEATEHLYAPQQSVDQQSVTKTDPVESSTASSGHLGHSDQAGHSKSHGPHECDGPRRERATAGARATTQAGPGAAEGSQAKPAADLQSLVSLMSLNSLGLEMELLMLRVSDSRSSRFPPRACRCNGQTSSTHGDGNISLQGIGGAICKSGVPGGESAAPGTGEQAAPNGGWQAVEQASMVQDQDQEAWRSTVLTR